MVFIVMWSWSSASRNAMALASAGFRRQTVATASSPLWRASPLFEPRPPEDSAARSCNRPKASVAMTSSGVPSATMRPPSTRSTRSNLRNREPLGCMETTRVRPAMQGPRTSSSKRWLLVCTSTEANGSSKNTTLDELRYAARASATRARWPPESRMPWEPIITASAPGRISRSGVSAAACSAWKYFCWSKAPFITTFSFKVPSKIQGTWEQKATCPVATFGHMTVASLLTG
mmetsp:Transcript_125324/g.362581  ORF Transcript_125324/g.362581 Transcript_125324/m.362581 type:complete len:232 (-) Transcript_125324:1937-2632(-)